MPSHEPRRLARRDWLVVLTATVAAIAAALPGFHLLELWLPWRPAMLISHGLGLALLAFAVQQWRMRRRAAASGAGGAGAA